jgi:hypothetical protein
MQRTTPAATDFTHTPISQEGALEDLVALEPGERELILFLNNKGYLNPLRVSAGGPVMRSISAHYYQEAAQMITHTGGYASIQQGCWMSPTVHSLPMKRFLYRTPGNVYCEIVVYPGSPEQTYVLKHHTDLPITDLPDLQVE